MFKTFIFQLVLLILILLVCIVFNISIQGMIGAVAGWAVGSFFSYKD
jgi:hypothetical protein